ncbi:hypothetical protein ONE63_011087 [Megalurothrips usitatus]|uniref:Uncharacterized protein n=1 Tax=Megalurothrips usitatus TaxID=439358 RepID=A0AAV7XGY0_9NEOP|nr:hypothetical protein ONE63_011087 [Megalurothrips usitatus]
MDPEWTLSMLRSASPSVEELEVVNVGGEQLAVVHAMPRLRRLHVNQDDDARLAAAPELPPLQRGGTLQHLTVSGVGLRRRTLVSLLRGCASSLTELQLSVGTAGDEPWPECWNELPAVLAECNLVALRLLQLIRGVHTAEACSQQKAALRRVLPKCDVRCTSKRCDGSFVQLPLEHQL